jgi:hypothetical protein
MVLQNHFHIVQTLRGRCGDDDVVRLLYIGLDLFIGSGRAAEFGGIDRETLLAHIIDADDLAAEPLNGSAVMAGDVAAADHENVHKTLLYFSR